MQQEQPTVCSRCGHNDPGSYCPSCGMPQPKPRSSSGSRAFPWKPVIAVILAVTVIALILAVIYAVTALIYTLVYEDSNDNNLPTVDLTHPTWAGPPRPTATPTFYKWLQKESSTRNCDRYPRHELRYENERRHPPYSAAFYCSPLPTPTPPPTPTVRQITEQSPETRRAWDKCQRSGGEFRINNITQRPLGGWTWRHWCIPPTATAPPPVHTLVTCRGIADRLTLANDSIRKITSLRVKFRAQDRMECLGWVDVEWAEDEWVTLSAERDYEGGIYYSLDWD